MSENKQKLEGFVKFFNNQRGFGFITVDDLEEDVFVHYSNINMEGFKKLDQGDLVEFELNESSDGDKSPEAQNVIVKVKDRRFRF